MIWEWLQKLSPFDSVFHRSQKIYRKWYIFYSFDRKSSESFRKRMCLGTNWKKCVLMVISLTMNCPAKIDLKEQGLQFDCLGGGGGWAVASPCCSICWFPELKNCRWCRMNECKEWLYLSGYANAYPYTIGHGTNLPIPTPLQTCRSLMQAAL